MLERLKKLAKSKGVEGALEIFEHKPAMLGLRRGSRIVNAKARQAPRDRDEVLGAIAEHARAMNQARNDYVRADRALKNLERERPQRSQQTEPAALATPPEPTKPKESARDREAQQPGADVDRYADLTEEERRDLIEMEERLRREREEDRERDR